MIDSKYYLYAMLFSAAAFLTGCPEEPCNEDIEQAAYIKSDTPSFHNFFGLHLAVSKDKSTFAITDNTAVSIYTSNNNSWSKQASIPSPTTIPEVFGSAVSLSANGNTLAVSAAEAGCTYVYKRSGNTWGTPTTFHAPVGDGSCETNKTEGPATFGYSIDLSDDGNTLAVGAELEGTLISGTYPGEQPTGLYGQYVGAVYIYQNTSNTWSQEAYIKPLNSGEYDRFGSIVALSGDGNTLAVSSDGEDGPTTGVLQGNDQPNTDDILENRNSGAVYVFERNNALWIQVAYLKSRNSEQDDLFGAGLALSGNGNTLAVTAVGEDNGANTILQGNNQPTGNDDTGTAENSGAIYVFNKNQGSWNQQAYIKALNNKPINNALLFFGNRISLSADGSTLAAGITKEDNGATGISACDAQPGPDDDDGVAQGSGAAYVFTRNDGEWRQDAYIKSLNSSQGDGLGTSVSLSGDGSLIAVGAGFESNGASGIFQGEDQPTVDDEVSTISNSGAAYLFNN